MFRRGIFFQGTWSSPTDLEPESADGPLKSLKANWGEVTPEKRELRALPQPEVRDLGEYGNPTGSPHINMVSVRGDGRARSRDAVPGGIRSGHLPSRAPQPVEAEGDACCAGGPVPTSCSGQAPLFCFTFTISCCLKSTFSFLSPFTAKIHSVY